MRKTYNTLRTALVALLALTSGGANAQCVTPVITTATNDGPGCPGTTVTLRAAGTIGANSAAYTRMAGIGGNFGNQEFNVLFASNDRPGTISRITEAQFNTLAAGGASALRAQYDVLLFTWASDPGLNASWSLIEGYLALGGSVFWEDDVNVGDLSAGIGAVGPAGTTGGCAYTLVNPAPYPELVANGVTGCFANDHLYLTSWPSWMHPYITASGRTLAIAGIHPTGGGRLIIQGPDQDFHAVRGDAGIAGNQYQFMLNQMDFLTANQGGFTWTGPNGFTATGANATVVLSPSSAGTYTVKLTNTNGGGCFTTQTTTVSLNAIPNVYTITGGGNYCQGAGGVAVGLSSSETGVSYQLKLNGANVGSSVAGTGAALSFGNMTATGVYTVSATGATCSVDMNGSATVTTNKSAVINAGGPTTFCPETGVTLAGALTGDDFTTGTPTAYAWNNSATTASIFTNQSGTNTVTISLDNNCTTTATVATTALVTTVDAGADVTICPGTTTQLNAVGSNESSGSNTYNVCIYDAPGGSGGCNFNFSNMCSDGYVNFGSSSSNSGVLSTSGSVSPQSLQFKVYFTNCAGNINFTFKLNNNTIYTAASSLASCKCTTPADGTYPLTFNVPLSAFMPYWSTSGTNTFSVQTSGGNIYIAGEVATLSAATSSYSWTPAASLSNTTVKNPVANPVATTNYTVTYTSPAGCHATDQVTVNMNNDAPVPAVATLPTVTAECSAMVTTAPTANDYCSGLITGTTTDPLNYSTQGTHTITWKYVDAQGHYSTQTQDVIIHDMTAPVADVASLPTVTGECSATIATAPTATDNCAGTITGTTADALTYNTQGTHVIHWTFDDGNGNTTSANQNVIVRDVTAPAADLTSLPDVTGECSASVTAPTATDNCIGTVTGTTSDPTSYEVQGTYIIHWTYDDGHGNTSTQDQTVIVKDVTKPVITAPASIATCDNGTNSYTLAATGSDNCHVASISYVVSGATNCSGSGYAVSKNFGVGTSTISWTITDDANNVSTASATVTIWQLPSVSVANINTFCKQNTIYLGYGPQSLTLAASASSGTPGYTYKWDSNAYGPDATYLVNAANTYVVTVRDANGCTASASKQVIVKDVRCGNKNDKVQVCHNGNNAICISPSAVPTHLDSHGDCLGDCTTAFAKGTVATHFDLEGGNIVVFPNPAHDKINVELKEIGSSYRSYQITDINGRVLLSQDLKGDVHSDLISVDVSKLVPGIYIIRAITDNGANLTKFIVQ